MLLFDWIKIISNYAAQLRWVYERWILIFSLFMLGVWVLLSICRCIFSWGVEQLLVSLIIKFWIRACCCVSRCLQRSSRILVGADITADLLLLEYLLLQASCMVTLRFLSSYWTLHNWVVLVLLLRLTHHWDILVWVWGGVDCVGQLILLLLWWNLNFFLRLSSTYSAIASQFNLSDVPAVREAKGRGQAVLAEEFRRCHWWLQTGEGALMAVPIHLSHGWVIFLWVHSRGWIPTHWSCRLKLWCCLFIMVFQVLCDDLWILQWLGFIVVPLIWWNVLKRIIHRLLFYVLSVTPGSLSLNLTWPYHFNLLLNLYI